MAWKCNKITSRVNHQSIIETSDSEVRTIMGPSPNSGEVHVIPLNNRPLIPVWHHQNQQPSYTLEITGRSTTGSSSSEVNEVGDEQQQQHESKEEEEEEEEEEAPFKGTKQE